MQKVLILSKKMGGTGEYMTIHPHTYTYTHTHTHTHATHPKVIKSILKKQIGSRIIHHLYVFSSRIFFKS